MALPARKIETMGPVEAAVDEIVTALTLAATGHLSTALDQATTAPGTTPP